MDALTKLKDGINSAVIGKSLKKITLSRPSDKNIIRTECRLINMKGGIYLQAETFLADGKAIHKNIPFEEASDEVISMFGEYRQINVIAEGGSVEGKVSSKGKLFVSGKIAPVSTTAEIVSHNRQKSNILNEGTVYPFLVRLGVSDENGRVFDRKRAKFRQIDRFLHYVDEIYSKLGQNGLYVLDLCCGKSYLTFAVYWFLTEVKGRSVKMVGADLKSDVIADCSKIAKELGYDGLTFKCCDITAFVPERRPNLVLSLHACDIATDIVLTTAAKLGADVILSTPCCHHQVFSQLNENKKTLTAFSSVLEHSLISQKLASALTDALRCKRLQSCGYTVDVTELIDPENTPKNLMIRAVRSSISESRRKRYNQEFNELSELFGLDIHGGDGSDAQKYEHILYKEEN